MNKLDVLKQYLKYVIDNKEKHIWTERNSCHCGMLLNSVNLSTENVANAWIFRIDNNIPRINRESSLYREIFYMYSLGTCDTTQLPFTEVLNTLISYGFTLQELISLEHLTDTRFNLDIGSDYKTVDNLILYLNNWINYEQQLVRVKEQTLVKVSVS